jgi:hypothetical protein
VRDKQGERVKGRERGSEGGEGEEREGRGERGERERIVWLYWVNSLCMLDKRARGKEGGCRCATAQRAQCADGNLRTLEKPDGFASERFLDQLILPESLE